MGDKGGKKDKEKGQKQNAERQKQKSQDKQNKQPKRKPYGCDRIAVNPRLYRFMMEHIF